MSIERQPRIPQEDSEKPIENNPLSSSLAGEEQPVSKEKAIVEPEVRQYSRLADTETRQQLAQEITERRSLRQRLSSIDQNAAQRSVHIENLTKSAENLRQQADSLSSSVWGRITSWNTRPRLEALIQRKITLKEVYERELAELQLMKADAELVLKGREDIADDQSLLASYYKGAKESLESFKKDTQVENVMNEQKVLFVHGMSKFVPEYNSVLMPDGRVDLETKLKILLSLQPSISTSTIKEGEGGSHLMHNVGVILNGGRVETAHGFDSRTVPLSVKSRDLRFAESSEQQEFLRDPKSQIAKAIHEKSDHWNELVVSEPTPAALYFTHELYEEGGYRKKVQALQELSQKYNLPLYCLKDGKAYEFTLELKEAWDKFSGKYKFYELTTKKEISIAEITEAKQVLESTRKTELLNEVLKELPFNPERIGINEAVHIKNSELGRKIACVLHALKNPESGAEGEYKAWKGETNPDIPEGSSMRVVGDFHALAGRSQYFFHEGELYERFSRSIWYHRPQEPNIYVGKTEYAVFLYEKIHSSEEFFGAVQKRFQEIQQREEEYKAKGEDNPKEENQIRELKEKVSLILYGFAQEAATNAEQDDAQQAEALAGEIGVFSLEQYKDLRARRIKDGTFVLYPEDIGI